MRLERRSFLDPRPAAQAEVEPIKDSVNIPLAEVGGRMSELPPKDVEVVIVGPEELGREAVAVLRDRGRRARFESGCEFGEEQSKGRLWEPNDWLAEVMRALTPGRALDLGCGAGREAVYLASQGWSVLAVDRLPECAERGRRLALRYLEFPDAIQWQTADVLAEGFLPGSFDLVFFSFLFDRTLIERSKGWLVVGGSVIVEAFTAIRRAKEGKPASADRVVEPGEMARLLDGMDILRMDEGEHRRGHTVRAWARRW